MNKLLFKVAALVVSFGLASSVSAMVVKDNIILKDYNGGDYVALSAGESYSIVHSLESYGVPDSMQVDSAKLKLSFADDNFSFIDWDFTFDWDIFGGQEEYASVSGAGISGSYEIDGNEFDYFIKKITIGDAGLDALNTSGLLDVTVTAVSGDFYWKESKLKAVISEIPVTEVSEPGSLAILGLGLASLGWIRRRKVA